MKHFLAVVSLLAFVVISLSYVNHAGAIENSANNCSATLSPDLSLHVPIISFNNQFYWTDFQYANGLDFELVAAGLVSDVTPFNNCVQANLSSTLALFIPTVSVGTISYWADFQYTNDLLFTLRDANQTPDISWAINYFPIDVGNRWIYSRSSGQYREDEITGTETIDGVTTFIKSRIDPDNYQEKLWFSMDASSVLLHRVWSNDDIDPALDVLPPQTILYSSPHVVDHWTVQLTSGIAASIEVVSVNDTVTVPAGTFTGCIRIKWTDSKVRYRYFAPGVGQITNELPGHYIDELVYAKVASMSYGTSPY